MSVKKGSKVKHIIVSDENFERLRRYGYANDSMNDVITKILEKNKMLESASRVEARDKQILTETNAPLLKGVVSMNNDTIWDLNNSTKPKTCMQLWTIEDEHLVITDKTIVEKLGIIDNSNIFEQQVTPDNTILMFIKNF